MAGKKKGFLLNLWKQFFPKVNVFSWFFDFATQIYMSTQRSPPERRGIKSCLTKRNDSIMYQLLEHTHARVDTSWLDNSTVGWLMIESQFVLYLRRRCLHDHSYCHTHPCASHTTVEHRNIRTSLAGTVSDTFFCDTTWRFCSSLLLSQVTPSIDFALRKPSSYFAVPACRPLCELSSWYRSRVVPWKIGTWHPRRQTNLWQSKIIALSVTSIALNTAPKAPVPSRTLEHGIVLKAPLLLWDNQAHMADRAVHCDLLQV